MSDELKDLFHAHHIEVVQRLTAIETSQSAMAKSFDDHLKWSEKKAVEVDEHFREHDDLIARAKGVQWFLSIMWLALSGWVLKHFYWK